MMMKPMPTAWLILMNSRLSATLELDATRRRSSIKDKPTLGAPAHEQHAIPKEVARDIGEFLNGVGHSAVSWKATWDKREDKISDCEKING